MDRHRALPVLLSAAILVVAACASPRRDSGIELAGTRSPNGCDAWLNSRGSRFGGGMADSRYMLENRSTGRRCVATRAVVLFAEPLQPEAFEVTTPDGWHQSWMPCDATPGVCGLEWRSDRGVRPGDAAGGFGLKYNLLTNPRQTAWLIDVGGRRVHMPAGHISG